MAQISGDINPDVSPQTGSNNQQVSIQVGANTGSSQRTQYIRVRSRVNPNTKYVDIRLVQDAPAPSYEEYEFIWSCSYQGPGGGYQGGGANINIECRKVSDNSLFAVPQDIEFDIYFRDDDAEPGADPIPLQHATFPSGQSATTFQIRDIFENIVQHVWVVPYFYNTPVGENNQVKIIGDKRFTIVPTNGAYMINV